MRKVSLSSSSKLGMQCLLIYYLYLKGIKIPAVPVRMIREFTQPHTDVKNTEFPGTTQPFMHWISVFGHCLPIHMPRVTETIQQAQPLKTEAWRKASLSDAFSRG